MLATGAGTKATNLQVTQREGKRAIALSVGSAQHNLAARRTHRRDFVNKAQQAGAVLGGVGGHAQRCGPAQLLDASVPAGEAHFVVDVLKSQARAVDGDSYMPRPWRCVVGLGLAAGHGGDDVDIGAKLGASGAGWIQALDADRLDARDAAVQVALRKVQLNKAAAAKGCADRGAQQPSHQLTDVHLGFDARRFKHQVAVWVQHLKVAARHWRRRVEDERTEAAPVVVVGVAEVKLAPHLRTDDARNQRAQAPIV